MTTSGAPRPPLCLPSDQDASGRTLGEEEIALLAEVIRSGTLTSTKGRFVSDLESRFAAMLGVRHALACASGTGALHAAIAAIDPEPGDEVVTTPITDMGAISPILYQGAIPVFADVDPETCGITADTVAPRLCERTKAIIVTHLFGHPCEVGQITELGRSRGIPVIEDCSQAYLARDGGRLVGTIGAVATFSTQQGKHMTTGEGGLLVTDDDRLARRIRLFINKAWGYGDSDPDHYFLALNYRMTELQGAVGIAQLAKLGESIKRRIEMADALTTALDGVPGISTPTVQPGSVHTFWRYPLRVDPAIIPGGPDALGRVLRAQGVASAPRYIRKPAFACQVFRDQQTFGTSRYPFTRARPAALDYDPALWPGTAAALQRVLVLPWNERYTMEHVEGLAEAITHGVDELRRQGS